MKQFIFLMMALCTFNFAEENSIPAKKWNKQKRYAILVGVNQYEYLSDLEGAVGDSYKVSNALREVGHYDKIVIMNDEEGKRNSVLKPSKKNILSQYRNLLKEKPNMILFYFSGHGFIANDKNASNAITASDTKLQINGIVNEIKINELTQMINLNQTRQAVFLIDACRSNVPSNLSEKDLKSALAEIRKKDDEVARKTKPKSEKISPRKTFSRLPFLQKLPPSVQNAKGVVVISGTSPGDVSQENKKGGFFTQMFIKAILGRIADTEVEEYVTDESLYKHIDHQFNEIRKKNKNFNQRVFRITSEAGVNGEILLAYGRPPETKEVTFIKLLNGDSDAVDAKLVLNEDQKKHSLQFFTRLEDTGKYIKQMIGGISRLSYGYDETDGDGLEDTFTVQEFDTKNKLRFQHELSVIKDEQDKTIGWIFQSAYKRTKEDERDSKRENIYYQRQEYDILGNLTSQEYFDKEGKPLTINGIRKTKYFYDKLGKKLGEEYLDEDGKLMNDQDGISKYKITYNANEKIEKEEYFDHDGRLKKHPSGYSTKRYVYNEYGNITEIIHQDQTGIPASNKEKIYKYEYKYDDKGNLVEENYYDETGILRENEENIAQRKYQYDKEMNLIREEYFRKDGRRKIQNGISAKEYKYSLLQIQLDDKKEISINVKTEERYFLYSDSKKEELPAVNSEDVSIYKYTYDKRCLKEKLGTLEVKKQKYLNSCIATIQTFGVDEKPVTDKANIFETEIIYSKNIWKGEARRYLDINRKFLFSNLRNRALYKYDEEGNEILEEILDSNGKPAIGGTARIVREYNSDGKKILEKKFDGNSLLAGNEDAAVQIVYQYDKNGNKILKELFDSKKNLIKGEIYDYDLNGNLTLLKYYGKDRQLTEDTYGFAKYVYKYDLKGNRILEEYYDSNEKLKANESGIALKIWEYDENGNKLLEETYGTDRQLKEDYHRFARIVYQYDKNGNRILEEFYGSDKKLKGNYSGIAKNIWKYDSNGNKLLEETRDKNDQLKENAGGIARKIYKYDTKGNKILEEFYGSDGKLKDDNYGISKIVIRYDGNGNKLLEETYSVNGKLKENLGGIARKVYRYDANGNKILEEYYDSNGKLKEDYNGIARYVYQFDNIGNKILEEFYGIDERLVVNDKGIARYVYQFDKKGNKLSEKTYGSDGKLKGNYNGIAQILYGYDSDGKKIFEKFLDINGKSKSNFDEIATIIYKHDSNGNILLKETYNSMGNLEAELKGIARTIQIHEIHFAKMNKQYKELIAEIEKKEKSPKGEEWKDIRIDLEKIYQPIEEKARLYFSYQDSELSLLNNWYGHSMLSRTSQFLPGYPEMREVQDRETKVLSPDLEVRDENTTETKILKNTYYKYFENPNGPTDKRLLRVTLDQFYRPYQIDFLPEPLREYKYQELQEAMDKVKVLLQEDEKKNKDKSINEE